MLFIKNIKCALPVNIAFMDILSSEEIEDILKTIETDIEAKHTKPKNIRKYDFKIESSYSRKTIRSISELFELYADNLSNKLSDETDSIFHLHVAAVESMPYEKYIRSIPCPTYYKVFSLNTIGYGYLDFDPRISLMFIDCLYGGHAANTFYHNMTNDDLLILDCFYPDIVYPILSKIFKKEIKMLDSYLMPNLHYNPKHNDIGILLSLEFKYDIYEGIANIFLDKNISNWFQKGLKEAKPKECIEDLPIDLSCNLYSETQYLRDILNIKVGDTIPIKYRNNVTMMLDNKKILSGIILDNEVTIARNFLKSTFP
jgi:flagellar motor switch protein FliM